MALIMLKKEGKHLLFGLIHHSGLMIRRNVFRDSETRNGDLFKDGGVFF